MDPLNDLFAEHPQFRDGPNWICVRVRLSKSAETCELRPCWPEKLEVDEFIDAILGKTKIKHGTSKDAYETLRLVERIYENSGFYSDK